MRPIRAPSILALALFGLVASGADAPKPGPPRQIQTGLGIKLVLIPAGTFTMGSPPGEWGRGRNEVPRRKVAITRPFYMSRGEVANGPFLKFVDEMKHKPVEAGESDSMFLYYQRGAGEPKYRNRGPNRADHPAIWVSWYSALRFCNWLSAKEGLKPVYAFESARAAGSPPTVRMAHPYGGGYRLPTEAEWEYAARAGTTTAFSFGDDDRGFRKYAFSYTMEPFSGAMNNEAVHARQPNPWGLHQMHGNVHEWCWDAYAPRYDPNRTTDPLGPDAGQHRVTRGGAMKLPPCFGRSAARMLDEPTSTRYDLGFRVVRSLVPAPQR